MTISSSWLEQRAEELKAGVVFSTRLPLPRATPIAGGALAKAAWAFPVAGLLIGFIGAAVYAVAQSHFRTEIAPTGQMLMQLPQRMHWSESIQM